MSRKYHGRFFLMVFCCSVLLVGCKSNELEQLRIVIGSNKSQTVELGHYISGQSIPFALHISNANAEKLTINYIRPSCSCLSFGQQKFPFALGKRASAVIHGSVSAPQINGFYSVNATIFYKIAKKTLTQQFKLRMFITTPLVPGFDIRHPIMLTSKLDGMSIPTVRNLSFLKAGDHAVKIQSASLISHRQLPDSSVIDIENSDVGTTISLSFEKDHAVCGEYPAQLVITTNLDVKRPEIVYPIEIRVLPPSEINFHNNEISLGFYCAESADELSSITRLAKRASILNVFSPVGTFIARPVGVLNAEVSDKKCWSLALEGSPIIKGEVDSFVEFNFSDGATIRQRITGFVGAASQN